MTSEPPSAPLRVRIIDTSALIELKKQVKVEQQWSTLLLMSSLVASGNLAFPRQVAAEMKDGKFPDAPGAWAAHEKGWRVYSQPSDDSLAEVMGVAQLVDPSSEGDAADPYIAAMALEVLEAHPTAEVVVVTEDRVDRMPAKEALTTACDRLEIDHCNTEQFIEWLAAMNPRD